MLPYRAEPQLPYNGLRLDRAAGLRGLQKPRRQAGEDFAAAFTPGRGDPPVMPGPDGGGNLAEAGKMVFDHEGAVKAKSFGLDIVFDEVAEPFRTIELATAAACSSAAE